MIFEISKITQNQPKNDKFWLKLRLFVLGFDVRGSNIGSEEVNGNSQLVKNNPKKVKFHVHIFRKI